MTTKTPQTSGTTSTPGLVSFVGSGPGDPDLLTVRALDLIKSADVIVTEVPDHEPLVRRLLGMPDAAPEGEDPPAAGPGHPIFVDGGFGQDGQPLTHASRAKVVVRHGKKSRVVRLLAGDP